MKSPKPGSNTRLGVISTALLAWYEQSGRAHLPWRRDQSTYAVVVSEFMLQQTQVDRVEPLFIAFIAHFPSFAALGQGSQADVVRLWKGLGYNSRAVRLHALAKRVVEIHKGELPREHEALRALPGIGPYTHAAILAFAYNEPAIAFDTNIRRIVHRLFWGVEHPFKTTLSAIEEKAAQMLPLGIARDWNAAMMDLGSSICTARAPKCLICPLQQFCVASPIDASQLVELARKQKKKAGPQSRLRFEDTKRYMRGRIIDYLRHVPAAERISLLDLQHDLRDHIAHRKPAEVEQIVNDLVRDGLIEQSEKGICLRG